jgi:WhiB family redox-sensing transcriptional regulator
VGSDHVLEGSETVSPLPCLTEDADLWFSERPADLDRAKALCATCPIRLSCLTGALERQETWGVWGGEIVIDGTVVAYKRGRGRPRRSDTTRAA